MDMRAIELVRFLWRGGAVGCFWRQVEGGKSASYWRETPPDRLPRPSVGWNDYWCVYPAREIPQTNARGEATAAAYVRNQNAVVAAINCVYGDFDCKGRDKLKELARIERLPLAPSVVISSGGGWHAYWLLREPYALNTQAAYFRAHSAVHYWPVVVDADKGAADLTRVLRIPGTHNYKAKYAPNYPLVYFERCNLATQYTLEDIERHIPIDITRAPKNENAEQPINAVTPSSEVTAALFRDAEAQIARAADGERHHTIARLAYVAAGYAAAGFGTANDWSNVLLGAVRSRGDAAYCFGAGNAAATIESGLRQTVEAVYPSLKRLKAAGLIE